MRKMSLGSKQRIFTKMIAELILYMYSKGYEVTFGDAYRDPRVPYGHPQSLHKMRLAVDLNLFLMGAYLTKTEDHKVFGVYWEEVLGPKYDVPASWGGHFNDGNHYSIAHGGVK